MQPSGLVNYETLRPSGLIGHGYGIVGTILILANLLYLARRRLARWSLGSMKTWLNLHVFTGLFGSLLILFHSAFQFRTPIALVTAISLGVVVVTGIAGRYLYALTPRPDRQALDGALSSLDELAPGCSARVYQALAIHQVTQVDTHHWLIAKLAAIPKWASEARSRGFLVSYAIEAAIARRKRIGSAGEERRTEGRRVTALVATGTFTLGSFGSARPSARVTPVTPPSRSQLRLSPTRSSPTIRSKALTPSSSASAVTKKSASEAGCKR